MCCFWLQCRFARPKSIHLGKVVRVRQLTKKEGTGSQEVMVRVSETDSQEQIMVHVERTVVKYEAKNTVSVRRSRIMQKIAGEAECKADLEQQCIIRVVHVSSNKCNYHLCCSGTGYINDVSAQKRHVHVLSTTQSIYDRNSVQTTHTSQIAHTLFRESQV